jgi:hypothetical protein
MNFFQSVAGSQRPQVAHGAQWLPSLINMSGKYFDIHDCAIESDNPFFDHWDGLVMGQYSRHPFFY